LTGTEITEITAEAKLMLIYNEKIP